MNVLTSFRGERCGIDNCRSKRYHRADDGLVYCQNGHQSSATFETELENDYIEASQATTRAHRSSPEAAQKSAFLEPREAAQTFLRCVQFVLQRQVTWVAKHVPSASQLEGIVKDLWTVHLQLIESSILKALAEHEEPTLYMSRPRQGEDSAVADAPPELSQALSLIDCCSLIYLGCVTLRLPIALGHVHDWIRSDTFPFITTASLIPHAIFAKLPLVYRRTFHARTGAPDPGVLHRTTMRMAAAHAVSRFSIQYPPLNHHLLMFDFLVALSLPQDMFPIALKLAECLQCDFTFPLEVQKYTWLVTHPELQLLCLLIVATKLVCPFDGVPRIPHSNSEPATMQIDWKQWAKVRAKAEMTAAEKTEALLRTQEHEVLEMSGNEMDDYLDWFQSTWINEQAEDRGNRADFRRQLGKMFPLQAPEHRQDETQGNRRHDSVLQHNIRSVQASLRYVKPIATREEMASISRPGHAYAHYRKAEDLPALAVPFFEAASPLGAVTIDQLTQAVYRTEMRLKQWTVEQAD